MLGGITSNSEYWKMYDEMKQRETDGLPKICSRCNAGEFCYYGNKYNRRGTKRCSWCYKSPNYPILCARCIQQDLRDMKPHKPIIIISDEEKKNRIKSYQKKYREKNRDILLQKMKKNRYDNIEERRKKENEYYHKNRQARIMARMIYEREQLTKNPNRRKELYSKLLKKNPNYNKDHYDKYREHRVEYARNRRQNKPELIRQINNRSRLKHRDKRILECRNWRLRKKIFNWGKKRL